MEEFDEKELSGTYKKLNKVLDTTFEKELFIEDIDKQIKKDFKSELDDEDLKFKAVNTMDDIKREVVNINTRKDELQEILYSAKIKDASFLEKEIKSMILSSRRVLSTLEKDIKLGSAPRMYEVYATLLNAITGQYKELRSLNEAIAKYVLENKKQNLDEVKEEHKMVMNSNDALDMYMAAKESSQMDTVTAEFDILDEDININKRE